MDLGLAGKRVLVTGSHRGTGEATARAFGAEGAKVFVHGFEPGQADVVAASICEDGGRAEAVFGDITTEEGADQLCAQVNRHVDVLVNNYGVAIGGSWSDETSATWLEMYERNVLCGVRMAHRFLARMREEHWGRVIFVGTVGSVRPRAVMPGYYAAKAALPAVALSLAKELAGTGVTVNCVSPGVLRTAEVEAHFRARALKKSWGADWEEIERRAIAETIGPGSAATRFGLPREAAAAVLFLASEHAGYVNAVDLRVDGGAADCVR